MMCQRLFIGLSGSIVLLGLLTWWAFYLINVSGHSLKWSAILQPVSHALDSKYDVTNHRSDSHDFKAS